MSDWYFKYENNSFIKKEYLQPISINDSEILVKPLSVDICGSDLFSIKNEGDSASIGHEWVGEVTQVGSDVVGVQLGEIVTSSANYCCQTCEFCLREEWSHCVGRKLLGTDDHSVISSHVKVHFSDLVKLPQELSLDALVLLEVAFIGDMSYFKAKEIGLKKGDSIAVFGAGPIGVFTYLSLKHRGFSPLLVEKNSHRVENAKRIGLNVENFAAFLISGSHFNKYDYVIDCTGDGAGGAGALPQLHLFPKPSGGVVIIGKYLDAKLDNNSYYRKNLRVNWLGEHSVEDFRKSVTFWTPIIEQYSNLLVEVYDFEDIDVAFKKAKDRHKGKIVLQK